VLWIRCKQTRTSSWRCNAGRNTRETPFSRPHVTPFHFVQLLRTYLRHPSSIISASVPHSIYILREGCYFCEARVESTSPSDMPAAVVCVSEAVALVPSEPLLTIQMIHGGMLIESKPAIISHYYCALFCEPWNYTIFFKINLFLVLREYFDTSKCPPHNVYMYFYW
jgi:hypothetical protein